MTNKLEISRELLANFIEYSSPISSTDQQWHRDKQELRALLAALVVEDHDAEALKRAWQAGYDTGFYAKNPAHERPAAPVVERQPMNQCDGCRAGKPLENGKLHIMVNAGGYRDVMACTAHLYAEQPAPVAVLPSREVMRDLIAEIIGGDTYDCTRVWSAWGVGTMSEDDFVPFVEQDERLYELADACLDKVKELNQ